MSKILRLSQIHNGHPLYVRADYVVSVEAHPWLDDDGRPHASARIMVLTGYSFTVSDALDVVQQMWLAALGE